jgi:hypothetical protein
MNQTIPMTKTIEKEILKTRSFQAYPSGYQRENGRHHKHLAHLHPHIETQNRERKPRP